MAKSLQAGDRAPEIELPDQDGKPRSLSALRGKWVLVYFYPRDDTPGCTVEACGLRDAAAPYAKLGLGSAIWRITNGGGTAKVDGVTGSGISWGPQGALGAMLLLDFFDQSSAKNLDNELGINNSYFFFEWYLSKLGIGDQLEVGTSSWALGLAFEI